MSKWDVSDGLYGSSWLSQPKLQNSIFITDWPTRRAWIWFKKTVFAVIAFFDESRNIGFSKALSRLSLIAGHPSMNLTTSADPPLSLSLVPFYATHSETLPIRLRTAECTHSAQCERLLSPYLSCVDSSAVCCLIFLSVRAQKSFG